MGLRLLRFLFLPVSLLILVAAMLVVRLPLFLEIPGDVVDLGERVTVGVPEPAEVTGDYLLTSVNLRRATIATVIPGLLDGDTTVIFREQLIPPGQDDRSYFERQRDVFAEAAGVAAALGLEAAGFEVDPSAITGDGARVIDVVAGAPADGVLRSGDVITEADGVAVRTADELVRVVTRGDARERRLTIERDGVAQHIVVVPERIDTPEGSIVGVGVVVNTANPRVDLPVDVDVDAGRIGGPSAGLVVALTVYDLMTPDEDLAGGRRVAATGVLSPEGEVRPVGGMRPKLAGVDRAGADVFLVPRDQFEEAQDALAGSSPMEVVGVSTFRDALEALGHAPAQSALPSDRAA